MSIQLIVCVDENYAIGNKSHLLFEIENDLRHFKEITTYNEYGLKNFIVMGRKTFQSLKKPLKDRINVVITRDKKFKVNDLHVIVCNSLRNVINQYLSGEQQKEMFIIGGFQIYEQAIPYVDTIHLTHIHNKAKHADTYFNQEWLNSFEEVSRETHWSDKYECRYDFVTYERKSE